MTTTSVCSSSPRAARSSSRVANDDVELADLLEVEVEVLVVRVVVRVGDLHEGDARLEQPAGQQAVAAEVVGAVAVQVLGRLLGDVEDLAAGHQLLGLLVRGGVGLGLGGPAAAGEPVVGVHPQGLAARGPQRRDGRVCAVLAGAWPLPR